mmetsp:Transcript_13269/g.13069  ORF Transcript_13269/g.13069 Transcript_13269/m.13069 type:complete len:175 (+) Transcript_13269:232-756(+)
MFVKHHVRALLNLVLGKMKFKSAFVHTESVMVTYAMALPSACIVDIGSSKINVCCVDEGLIAPKSIIRKHFGGDDINEVLYRLMNRSRALHYFPKHSLCPDYHYHKLLIEQLKEQFCTCEMDSNVIVKTCSFSNKDFFKHAKGQEEEKVEESCAKMTINCSDALLFAGQSLFYS